MDKKKDCFKCKHYFVTWDARYPKGCRLYDVKSTQMPWVIVASATKEGCVGFEPKENKSAGKKDDLDLNRDDLW